MLFRHFGAFDYLVETLVLRFVHCVEEGVEDLAARGVFGEVEGKHHIRSLLLCGRCARKMIDEMGLETGSEAIVYIDNARSACTGIEHGKQGRQATE